MILGIGISLFLYWVFAFIPAIFVKIVSKCCDIEKRVFSVFSYIAFLISAGFGLLIVFHIQKELNAYDSQVFILATFVGV